MLIWGASGGLGSYATQFALNGGATPVCVVSSPEKAEICRRMGAELRHRPQRRGLQVLARRAHPGPARVEAVRREDPRADRRRRPRHRLRAPGPRDLRRQRLRRAQAAARSSPAPRPVGLHARVRQPLPVDEPQADHRVALRELPRGLGGQPAGRQGPDPPDAVEDLPARRDRRGGATTSTTTSTRARSACSRSPRRRGSASWTTELREQHLAGDQPLPRDLVAPSSRPRAGNAVAPRPGDSEPDATCGHPLARHRRAAFPAGTVKPMPAEPVAPPSDGVFTVGRRGYDPHQVDAHLRRLDAEIRILVADRDAAVDQAAQLGRDLEEARLRADRLRTQVRTMAARPSDVQGMSERMRTMLRLAEDEVADMLRRADAEVARPARRRGPRRGAGHRGRRAGGRRDRVRCSREMRRRRWPRPPGTGRRPTRRARRTAGRSPRSGPPPSTRSRWPGSGPSRSGRRRGPSRSGGGPRWRRTSPSPWTSGAPRRWPPSRPNGRRPTSGCSAPRPTAAQEARAEIAAAEETARRLVAEAQARVEELADVRSRIAAQLRGTQSQLSTAIDSLAPDAPPAGGRGRTARSGGERGARPTGRRTRPAATRAARHSRTRGAARRRLRRPG